MAQGEERLETRVSKDLISASSPAALDKEIQEAREKFDTSMRSFMLGFSPNQFEAIGRAVIENLTGSPLEKLVEAAKDKRNLEAFEKAAESSSPQRVSVPSAQRKPSVLSAQKPLSGSWLPSSLGQERTRPSSAKHATYPPPLGSLAHAHWSSARDAQEKAAKAAEAVAKRKAEEERERQEQERVEQERLELERQEEELKQKEEELKRFRQKIEERKRLSMQPTRSQSPRKSISVGLPSPLQSEEFLEELKKRLTQASTGSTPTPVKPSSSTSDKAQPTPRDRSDDDDDDAAATPATTKPIRRNPFNDSDDDDIAAAAATPAATPALRPGKLRNPPCLHCVKAVYLGHESYCRDAVGKTSKCCFGCLKNGKKCEELPEVSREEGIALSNADYVTDVKGSVAAQRTAFRKAHRMVDPTFDQQSSGAAPKPEKTPGKKRKPGGSSRDETPKKRKPASASKTATPTKRQRKSTQGAPTDDDDLSVWV